MDRTLDPLLHDLLSFVAAERRTYTEVMEAWRTSCPKLPVWEEANDRGLVKRDQINGRCIVGVSPSGRALLDRRKTLAQ